MCGRFTLFVPAEELAQVFGVPGAELPGPRYNVAPSQPIAVVRLSPGGSGREMAMLRWGLIPSWAKDPSIGNRLINARAETVPGKPAFRGAFRSRRCLVPANGFYEWKRLAGRKQPYHVRMRDGRPFAMAGLWERWKDPSGAVRESCAVITTGANGLLAPIHDRMPAILAPGDYEGWLAAPAEEGGLLLALLRPYPPGEMAADEVGPGVNNPSNDFPGLIEAVG